MDGMATASSCGRLVQGYNTRATNGIEKVLEVHKNYDILKTRSSAILA